MTTSYGNILNFVIRCLRTRTIMSNFKKSVNRKGLSGLPTPKHSCVNSLPTSMAASILAKGVPRGDIIPHRATDGFLPKKGISHGTPAVCLWIHLSPSHSDPQQNRWGALVNPDCLRTSVTSNPGGVSPMVSPVSGDLVSKSTNTQQTVFPSSNTDASTCHGVLANISASDGKYCGSSYSNKKVMDLYVVCSSLRWAEGPQLSPINHLAGP